MLELVPELPELPQSLADDLRRVRDDEGRHAEIFTILAESLDDQDRLAPGVTPEDVARRIGAVGEDFLPRHCRPTASAHPARRRRIGLGRRWASRAARSTSDSGACSTRPAWRGGSATASVPSGDRPGRSAWRSSPPSCSDTTGRIGRSSRTRNSWSTWPTACTRCGCADVAVVEAPNIYDQFYANRGVGEVARYFGLESPSYRLVDLSTEQVPHTYRRGLAQGTVGRTWKEADFRISFGKMRSHPVELAYLSVGNVEWIGARCDEYLFPERQAQRETAIMMLLDAFPPHFALVEAYDAAADGLVGVMGCPRPPAPHRLYAASDALALDMVAARHMGVRDPRQSSLLRAACHWFGDPSARIEVVGVDEPLAAWRGPYHNDLSALLSILAMPVYVWGSGRGTLFVPEMDEEAFPPLRARGEAAAARATGDATAPRPEAPAMNRTVIVIGAGMGGLAAALRLARRGCRVLVIEASEQTGGLAAGMERDGLRLRRRPLPAPGPARARVGLPRTRARPGRSGPDAAGRGRLPG